MLPQAAKGRGMEKIGLWADKIVNHFWFCCEKCDQNVDDLKVNYYSCVSVMFTKVTVLFILL